MAKKRLDQLLVERDLAESHNLAQRFVIAGKVRVDGQLAVTPSQMVQEDAELRVDQGPRFVSRGGEKLAAALDAFAVDVQDLVCADAGASTGGFTDCLLQNGAAKVYAIDVGHGILDWKLRNDPRVVVMEQTNARHVENLAEPVDLVVIDASFISLKVLLPVIRQWFPSPSGRGVRGEGTTPPQPPPFSTKTGGEIIALIKPQFEATREEATLGKGVIRDVEIRKRVLHEIIDFATKKGFTLRGLIRSPIQGPKGNVEFLVWLEAGMGESVDQEILVENAMTNNENITYPKNVVSLIKDNVIRLEHIANELFDALTNLGGSKGNLLDKTIWTIKCEDDIELAKILSELNKLEVLFVGQPHGWPPAEIFADLREKNLLQGKFNEVTWIGPMKWVIRER